MQPVAREGQVASLCVKRFNRAEYVARIPHKYDLLCPRVPLPKHLPDGRGACQVLFREVCAPGQAAGGGDGAVERLNLSLAESSQGPHPRAPQAVDNLEVRNLAQWPRGVGPEPPLPDRLGDDHRLQETLRVG